MGRKSRYTEYAKGMNKARTRISLRRKRIRRPEQLTGYSNIRYSLHVAPHVRLIIEPNANQDTVMICTEIEVEGVCDYHGSKENWYIP